MNGMNLTRCDGGIGDDDRSIGGRSDIVQSMIVARASQSISRSIRAGNLDRRSLKNDFFAVRIIFVILKRINSNERDGTRRRLTCNDG